MQAGLQSWDLCPGCDGKSLDFGSVHTHVAPSSLVASPHSLFCKDKTITSSGLASSVSFRDLKRGLWHGYQPVLASLSNSLTPLRRGSLIVDYRPRTRMWYHLTAYRLSSPSTIEARFGRESEYWWMPQSFDWVITGYSLFRQINSVEELTPTPGNICSPFHRLEVRIHLLL